MRTGIDRFRRTYDASPLPVKILILVTACVLSIPAALILIPLGLVFAPYALISASRSAWATASIALWGIVAVALKVPHFTVTFYALWALPVAVALASHAGALGRWFAP